MNDDYSTSFTNSDFNPVTETKDFTSDYAPQMPADTSMPSSPESYDFTSDYAPAPPPVDTPDN